MRLDEGDLSEVGRELAASELCSDTIVVLQKSGKPYVTMWIALVGQNYIGFYSGHFNVVVVAHIREDSTLEDEKGERIKVFEYLGEP